MKILAKRDPALPKHLKNTLAGSHNSCHFDAYLESIYCALINSNESDNLFTGFNFYYVIQCN
jgi:hypothetical protein